VVFKELSLSLSADRQPVRRDRSRKLFDVSSSDKNVQTVVNGLFRQASPIHENRRRASPSLKLIEDFSVLTG
jgi:hypothetical protein